ncbi:unnamed protein product [Allacma fusca]|uniref:Chitin-binding type-2 domain-containing protein n=1 Tax=Allacma fusca TaxID=39272 RepID=A0A8J2PKE1_9HEXA|nr:unnamed protein product [Allacma fusca]
MWTQRTLSLCILLGFLTAKGLAQNCPVANGYFADSQQCDAYVECKDGVPEKQLCPDGLLFNDRLTGYPRYPCSYPQEVECGSRTRLQPAQSSGDCPHQYGLFRAGNPDQCGSYINCVAGTASISNCPEGLAFNDQTARCDWPDEVPSCNAASFVRFQCPGVRVEADLGHPRFSDPADCRKFYVCVEGTKPRALSCGVGSVFNPEIGVCDEPENVPQCASYYPADVLSAVRRLKSFDNSV